MPKTGQSWRRNAGAKALALLAALVLWASFSAEETGQESFEASVRFVRVPEGLEVNPDQTRSLTVVLEGSSTRLAGLRTRGVALVVDCSGLTDGDVRTATVSNMSLQLPTGVGLTRAVPSQLRFSLEKSETRSVTVEPSWEGVETSGLIVEEYNAYPEMLIVAGPAGRVNLLNTVTTDPIDLSSIPEDGVVETVAFLPDPYLRFIDNPAVRVEVKVRRR